MHRYKLKKSCFCSKWKSQNLLRLQKESLSVIPMRNAERRVSCFEEKQQRLRTHKYKGLFRTCHSLLKVICWFCLVIDFFKDIFWLLFDAL